MTTQNYLAIDLGAESGRGILAQFDGERLALNTLGRFVTSRGPEDIGPDGIRRWDFDRIAGETEKLVRQAQQESQGALQGVGVDTWGVDYGLLDSSGDLLEMPVQYRDPTIAEASRLAPSLMSADELWEMTGIQSLPFNTLYQLMAVQKRAPQILDRARTLLLMPDLLHRRLTGGKNLLAETTDASTSQMLDPHMRQWNKELMVRFGLPSHFLGELTTAGTKLGTTPDGVPVYAPATHDTASAVVATPAEAQTRWAFISSGTWSLLGTERTEPFLSQEARIAGFSNEAGVGGTTRLLQNIMGLWMVQECRRAWQRSGQEYTYDVLTVMAEAAPEGGPVVNAVDTRFLAPADMVQEISRACQETGQTPPDGVGPMIRCCLDSLAVAYRIALGNLGSMLGQKFEVLHIVGGGAQNKLLSQLAADACGIPVVAGPVEATAIGNVLGQMVGSGAVRDWAQARLVARQSFPIETYLPRPRSAEQWAMREEQLSL